MIELSPEAFEELVVDAIDGLPTELAALTDNVAIFVEEDPPPGEDLLGLYEGVPLTERTSSYLMAVPDRITVYRRPILAMCSDAEEVREEVQVTVVHELAHHFGIDDNRLHELGYA